MKLVTCLSFLLIDVFICAVEQKTYQLELVQALFRHGDRTPEGTEVYKTDPYDPEYYESIGYGQLTKIGMMREYQIGVLLRLMYKKFLGEYGPDKVYAYSTEYDRTKMSLQLVLAGLFPPSPSSNWNKKLMWRPIPTHYAPMSSDFLLTSIKGACADFNKVMEGFNHPLIQERLAEYSDFTDYVRNKTEMPDSSILSMIAIAGNLRAIRSMGLKLPSWCSEEDYKMIGDLLVLGTKILTITPELRRQNAGPMVQRFLQNMKNHEKDDDMKIFLYSGHDLNVASFTGAHNFTGIPATPDYGSTVIIEKLRGSDNNSYVRMFLWTGVSGKLIKLKLENCDYICLLSDYEKIATPLLPDPELEKCLSENVP